MKFFAKMVVVLLIGANSLQACTAKAPAGPLMKVQIGTAASFMPFEFVDISTRNLSGFDIELMQAIGKAANLDVEFENTSYERIILAVTQCEVDAVIAAIPITNDLKQKMAFSNPYYSIGQVVVVQNGNFTITGQDTLPGKTVGFQKKTNSEIEANKIGGLELRPYDSYTIAFDYLMYGIDDAVITDKITALSFTNQAANNLKIVGKEFGIEDLGVAVCSQKAELLNRINEGLAFVKASGTMSKLIQKWLTNPVIN